MLKKNPANSDDLRFSISDQEVEKHPLFVVVEPSPKLEQGLFALFYRRTADILAARRRTGIKIVK